MGRLQDIMVPWRTFAVGISISFILRPAQAADTVSALSPNEIVAIVVGSVVGALLLAALVCLCLCVCCRPSRRKREEEWKQLMDMGIAGPPPSGPGSAMSAQPSGRLRHAASSAADRDRRGGGGGSGSVANPLHVALNPDAAATADRDVEAPLPLSHGPRETATAGGAFAVTASAGRAGGAASHDSGSGGGGRANDIANLGDVHSLAEGGPAEGEAGDVAGELGMSYSGGRAGSKRRGIGALLPKAFSAPWGSGGKGSSMRLEKDKHLEVSRSARVEPSAEVELPAMDTAATNHGPPLSKSSMLLRWLNAFDEPRDVAERLQQAAAGAASGGGGKKGANPYADNLPLLSLAAQSGIVFNKMPPSVTSSPAVSMTEGSTTRHMLKMKRLDSADPSAAGPVEPADPTSLYPPSLSRASVESLTQRAAQQQRPGIAYESLTGAPLSARAHYSPAAAPPPGSAAAVVAGLKGAAGAGATPLTEPRGSVSHVRMSFAREAVQQQQQLVGGPAAAVVASPTATPSTPPSGIGAGFAAAASTAVTVAATRSPMLHETPPRPLATLAEGDDEGGAAAAAAAAAAPGLMRATTVNHRSGSLPDGLSYVPPSPVPPPVWPPAAAAGVAPAVLPATPAAGWTTFDGQSGSLPRMPAVQPPAQMVDDTEYEEAPVVAPLGGAAFGSQQPLYEHHGGITPTSHLPPASASLPRAAIGDAAAAAAAAATAPFTAARSRGSSMVRGTAAAPTVQELEDDAEDPVPAVPKPPSLLPGGLPSHNTSSYLRVSSLLPGAAATTSTDAPATAPTLASASGRSPAPNGLPGTLPVSNGNGTPVPELPVARPAEPSEAAAGAARSPGPSGGGAPVSPSLGVHFPSAATSLGGAGMGTADEAQAGVKVVSTSLGGAPPQ